MEKEDDEIGRKKTGTEMRNEEASGEKNKSMVQKKKRRSRGS